jgi:pimeloyl-ACP methyl ester carboxylesterase
LAIRAQSRRLLSTRAVQHGYTEVGGLRLHHLRYGGTGPPIVCLHGVIGHAWTWYQLAPYLAQVGVVHALDLRGHGESQWSSEGAYTTEDHVADLEGWLDAMGFDQVTLVGYSWGALIATSFASRQPDRVAKLVILDVEASFDQSADDVPPLPSSFASHDEAVASERYGAPHITDEMADVMAAAGTRPATDGTLVPRADPFFLREWPFRNDDHWSELPLLSMPVMLVHAAESFVRDEVMVKMAEQISDATFTQVEECGHVMPVDHPGGVALAVVPFLS